MLYSLSWYMSARQTALRAALSFHTPLSVTEQTDMRVHYSGYLLNLLAATELLRETTTLQLDDFESQLYSRLIFDGFQDGKANYSYLRELRNAVVHRGLDITSGAHIDGTFPMIIAEPTIQNNPGAKTQKTFLAFDKYLLHVIEKCESVVGPLMLDYLIQAGVSDAAIDIQGAEAEYLDAVQQSHAMPDDVKAMALATGFKPEWAVAAHNASMAKLRDALSPCETAKSQRYQTD
jgi:hypothetical protein